MLRRLFAVIMIVVAIRMLVTTPASMAQQPAGGQAAVQAEEAANGEAEGTGG